MGRDYRIAGRVTTLARSRHLPDTIAGVIIRHINPLMLDVIDDKPEEFIHYHINHERVYVL